MTNRSDHRGAERRSRGQREADNRRAAADRDQFVKRLAGGAR